MRNINQTLVNTMIAIVCAIVFAQDPNEPMILPDPGIEIIHKIDSTTVRVTTSVYHNKDSLLKQKKQLQSRITALEEEMAEIDKLLDEKKYRAIKKKLDNLELS